MTRRRHFGSVRRLSSGRWQARYWIGDGQRLTAPKTFATKAEATRWLTLADADRARGVWLDPDAGRISLCEYSWQWLAGKVRLAPRTREIYEGQIRLHILPVVTEGVLPLGPLPLAELTPELVRAWYGALVRQRTPSVAAKAYVRLRQILGQAMDDDRIGKNPCRIDGGGVEQHPEQCFAELSELHALADAVPPRFRVLVLLAGYTAIRPGELFALRRRQVDLLNGTVIVRRKRLRLSSGEVIEDEPKTVAGRRKVASPELVTAELEAHMSAFVGPEPDAYVFTSPTGLPMDRNNFRIRVWLPATRALGLEGLRFYDLRHTGGTLAARTGATTKELMARLGHASPRAAMVYQHATEERDKVIARRLGEMAAEAGLAKVVPIRRRSQPSRLGT